MSLNIYVPRDEQFGYLKMSDFLASALRSLVQFIVPKIKDLTDPTHNEFDSFEDVLDMYYGVKRPCFPLLGNLFEIIRKKSLIRRLLKFPVPEVIRGMLYVNIRLIWELKDIRYHFTRYILISTFILMF